MSSDPIPIHQPFSDEAWDTLRREIASAGGNEVLFFGWFQEGGLVGRVEVVARGNDISVGVPIERSYIPDVVIHNHPNGDILPSDQDVRMSSLIANRGVGFYIINNDATEVYTVVEPVTKHKTALLDIEKLKGMISAHGPFSSLFPNYEERHGQMLMIEHVAEAFNTDTQILVEAPTGIGKSLAYLIPSVEWALTNNEKVVVSTNTIHLQEQLLYKDIPDLQRATGLDFSYTLMKGRGNYICLNRFNEAKQDLFALIDDTELEQFSAIEQWLQTTDDVSLSSLPFMPGQALWEKINAQPGTCLGGGCEFFSECYVNRARRRAAEAHIIVTNHHYVLADAQTNSGAGLLPPYTRVIFDEAHNLEASATSFFTKTVTRSLMLRILNGLYAGSRKKKGYLIHLINKNIPSLKTCVQKAMDAVRDTRKTVFDFFSAVDDFIEALGTSWNEEGRGVFEINDELKNHRLWSPLILEKINYLYRECTGLVNSLNDVCERLSDERVVRHIEGFSGRIVDIIETVNVFLGDNDEEWVRWIQKKGEAGIVVARIEVGEVLNELVFRRMSTLVLTSATLTVDGRFDFIKTRLNLDREMQSVILESSFDYDRQMVALIPTTGTKPDRPGYIDSLTKNILSVLQKTRGGAFVLFTSYRVLNSTYEQVKEALGSEGYMLFRQGDETRSRLMERFKGDVHSVLFGTESFWEGVDAPGETLRCVIITKLPFKVPTEPIIRARIEKIRQRGGNPFFEYYVPLAVIKMKQGIGRLIRNRSDRGIIVILDNRVLLKNYGPLFIRSIPTKNINYGSLDELLDEAEPFLSITP